MKKERKQRKIVWTEDFGIAQACCTRQGISGDEAGDEHNQSQKTTSAV